MRETTFESALWFSGAGKAGQGGQGWYLSSTALFGGGGLPAGTFDSSTASEAQSTFEVEGIRFHLVQRVLPPGAAGSTFRQTYTITNTLGTPTNLDLIRYVDADLIFDGANNDRAGIAEGDQRLYLLDNIADVSAPTYRMSIDMAGQANLGYRIAEFHTGDNVFNEGRAVLTNQLTHDGISGVTENDANADLDGDRITDSSFDINLVQGSTLTLQPGQSAVLELNTILGMGSPEEAINPKIEWVDASPSVAAGESSCNSILLSRDAVGPIPNASILFNVAGLTGSNQSALLATDADGRVQFCFTPLFPGTDTLTATYDENGNGTRDPGEPTTVLTSTATLPATMTGQGKGKGAVLAQNRNGKFKLSVRGNKGRGKGQVRFNIPKQPRSTVAAFTVQGKKIDAVVFRQTNDGWRTEVLGSAKIKKGATVPFRVDALDRGPGSTLPDEFILTLLQDVDGDGSPDAVIYGGALIANAKGKRGNVVVRPPVTGRAK